MRHRPCSAALRASAATSSDYYLVMDPAVLAAAAGAIIFPITASFRTLRAVVRTELQALHIIFIVVIINHHHRPEYASRRHIGVM
jgi:hypothetical protein